MINFFKNLDFEKILHGRIKPLGIAAACFVAVFTAGYGVGQNSSYSNYTINSSSPTKPVEKKSNNDIAKTVDKTAEATNINNCNIKGSKSKIYHIPGGAFYNRTTASVCFNTEEEAQNAGYTKSSR